MPGQLFDARAEDRLCAAAVLPGGLAAWAARVLQWLRWLAAQRTLSGSVGIGWLLYVCMYVLYMCVCVCVAPSRTVPLTPSEFELHCLSHPAIASCASH